MEKPKEGKQKLNHRKRTSHGRRLQVVLLGLLNCGLILGAVAVLLLYSRNVRQEQIDTATDTFCSTVESMKQVAQNYLEMESVYAKSWAEYIQNHDMTMDEALSYIRSSNAQKDRYAHIVDMDTFEARSTYQKNGDDSVSCYLKMKTDAEAGNMTNFVTTMEQMLDPGQKGLYVLGKYRIGESQVTAVSVGTGVRLRTEDGERKRYLLLRVIPVESMKAIWIFPMDYSDAQVGMITASGDYVIQSNAMKAENFVEFIRSYNYADDYSGADIVPQRLQSEKNGIFWYQNAKGEDCCWYFSRFDQGEDLVILGYIPVASLQKQQDNWLLVGITCFVFLILIIVDGSYVMRMNRQLRRSAVLANQASEAKTQFLSTMSHDIRTPMNAVTGMTRIARQQLRSDPAYAAECLDKVLLASSHLLTLINDILDISKVESGKMVLNNAAFSLEQSLDEIINIVRPKAEEKGLTFELDIKKPEWNYLVGDELRLNQISINLLTNAVKYTNSGGTIRMRLHENVLPERPGKVRLSYCIEDSGIGMSEEFQKIMYDTFSRASDGRIDKIQGSGLGLAIVRQMVDLMGGTIRCESRPGVGTSFYVTVDLDVASKEDIRILQQNAEQETEAADNRTEFAGLNILIAEDNDLNWEIIQELLQEYGVSCSRAENGAECVEMLRTAAEHAWDAILMDVQMPVMNGKEASRLIRQADVGWIREIPIYAITADAFAEDIQECLEAGMNGHLSKPIDIKKVCNVLREVQRRKGESKS